MHAKLAVRAIAVFALVLSVFHGAAEAQGPTATLTITNNGPNSGAVGVQPGGNVCNPGGFGGGTCVFTYPVGTPLRIMANSPTTPGIFNSGTGDAAACATSVCEFTINGNSSITATFDAGGGPYPSLTINLIGDGKGNVGTDNNQCQNFELGFSACTTYYGAGSAVVAQGRTLPGNIFAGFSGGTVDAAGCVGTANCGFTLLNNSTVDASFSALQSVAVTPSALTINVGNTALFSSRATFTNGMTRFGFGGSSLWQNHLSMDVARFSLAASVVGDLLYAIGGVDGSCPGPPCPFAPMNTVEVFDPTISLVAQFNQVWTPRASMATPRESLASAVVNGRIYAIGGHTTGGVSVASMESYDPATNAWTARASMSVARARIAAAAINNTIYVAGGAGDDSVPLTTVEAYDAVTDTWTTKAPMLTARSLAAAAAVNGTLYVIGGDGSGSVEAYDPATNSWSMKAPMPSGGGFHTAAALNGLIYAIGGPSGTMKVYNPATNSWLTLGNMPSFQGQFALAVLDGRLFAAGGNLADNTAIATFRAIRPPETTWWSSNNAVGRINATNNGNVNGLSAGTSTISVRMVQMESGPQSALLTVNSGGGSQIFVNGPNQVFTEVGEANWGCGSFNQSAPGPWTATVNYGEGGGVEPLTIILNGTCFGSGSSTGVFFFNHAYSSPGTFHVVVTVRNTATNQTGTKEFDVIVEAPDCVPIVSNIAVIGSVPFDRVQVAVFNSVTDELLFEGELPLGFFDDASLPAGQYRIEFSVPEGYMITPSSITFDGVCGQTVNINATVQAIPVDPPTITLVSSPTTLWPPNHKMVTITIDVDASSPQGNPVSVELVSITSSEPGGEDDIAGAAFGTDDRVFELRATRLGGGPGRTYTVTYLVTDTVTGLSSTATTTIAVPHDMGQ